MYRQNLLAKILVNNIEQRERRTSKTPFYSFSTIRDVNVQQGSEFKIFLKNNSKKRVKVIVEINGKNIFYNNDGFMIGGNKALEIGRFVDKQTRPVKMLKMLSDCIVVIKWYSELSVEARILYDKVIDPFFTYYYYPPRFLDYEDSSAQPVKRDVVINSTTLLYKKNLLDDLITYYGADEYLFSNTPTEIMEFNLVAKDKIKQSKSTSINTFKHVTCKICGAMIDRNHRFCTMCGAQLVKYTWCGNCQVLIKPGDKYCHRCGNKF